MAAREAPPGATAAPPAAAAAAPSPRPPLKVGMTLDIQPGRLDEYRRRHDEIWPEVRAALRAAGLTNISLWAWPGGGRLFYYGEYAGAGPFDEAMARYAASPRVAEWEALMHTYQRRVVPGPRGGGGGEGAGGGGGRGEGGGEGGGGGGEGSVWWRPMELVYSSDF
jgi:L-rhamnose mutarotase